MNIITILAAIIMLGVIIFLHELGHFLVGRACGIGVVEFSIGMGPKIFGWEKNGTKYSLRWIPLGGYCAFVGEDDGSDAKNAMNAQPAWKRVLTVAAGPLMNFAVAFVLAVVLISTHSINNIFVTNTVPYITDVIEGMPAAEAGLMPEDTIIEVNGTEVTFDEAGVDLIKSCLTRDSAITMTVLRGENEKATISFVPEVDEETGALLMGVYFRSIYAQYDCNVIGAVPEAFKFMGNTIVQTLDELGGLLKDLFTGAGVQSGSVSGVVGIVSTVSSDIGTGFSDSISYGLFTIIYYVMAISLSIGIMNFLPFPALDGGRLVLLIIEMVTGKHLKRESEAVINLVGFAVLILLMIVVTFSDVRSLFR